IGKQTEARLIRRIEERIEEQNEVDDVVNLLTMMTSVDRMLLYARINLVNGFSTAELEQAFVRIDGLLREEFPVLDEIFLQPMPKWDRRVRARVRERYGHELADGAERRLG